MNDVCINLMPPRSARRRLPPRGVMGRFTGECLSSTMTSMAAMPWRGSSNYRGMSSGSLATDGKRWS